MPHVVKQMQIWQDDLTNRLKGREIPPKYWEYPELEKGNIHPQHCSSCVYLNCDAINNAVHCSMVTCKSGCGAKYHACKTSEHLIICSIGQVEDDYTKMYQGVSGEQRRCSGVNQHPTTYWSDTYFSDSFRKSNEKKKSKNDDNSKNNQRRHFSTIGDWFVGPNETTSLQHDTKERNSIPDPPLVEDLNKNQLAQSLWMTMSFTNEPKHSSKPILMYSFTCSQSFRRDQIQWHWKNVHDDIFGGLDDWVEHRCPLASYGCGFSTRRLHPKLNDYQNIGNSQICSTITYSPISEALGIRNTTWHEERKENEDSAMNRKQKTGFRSLPCEILYRIFVHLDSFR